uniref:hypothetical protein n=1 Tax=Paractinoplanes polyasparticus TaxID=2856853 RepID=UPI001C852B9D|nr:hypothetical protein [Actinoplanes polyasparticus]
MGLPGEPGPIGDSAGDDAGAMRDVVVRLLTEAVQASYAITGLQEFAAAHPGADPRAQSEIADAVDLLAGVRTALTRAADGLAFVGEHDS